MFRKLLIANRGEIACRVARTAKRMGIRTVAVYSEADANAMHVSMCDEAYLIGAAPARESYLRIDRILDAAKRSGAEAVHPGYGFLSENEDFADACAREGVLFVGPPTHAIRAMGSKSAAKALMAQAGVPLVPGYHGDAQDAATLRSEAQRIGFPVMIKASAGGGGKGMRIVRSAGEFDDALASAKREATSSFGDDHVLLERYLTRPRHVEFQVFADTHGNCVYLFERDCSVQRRHQKVLEEAPAPGMSAQRRRQMGSAAVASARAVDYVGAGTVEFILDESGEFYFMEMNTRLQVEHPVTEMITGLDLVEWQLRVAAGQPLPLAQEQLSINGHAIEARVYAEDPARDFVPSTGRLEHLREPTQSNHVRVDTGVREGDEIGIYYDPMIAKLICWDVDRAGALRRMRDALSSYQIVGLQNNIRFLSAVVSHRAFAQAHEDPSLLETGLIERHKAELFPERARATDAVLAIAVLDHLARNDCAAKHRAASSNDPFSPWHASSGWRLNEDNFHVFHLKDGEHEVAITAHYRDTGYELELPSSRMNAAVERAGDGTLAVDLQGDRCFAHVVSRDDELTVFAFGSSHTLTWARSARVNEEGGSGALTAPMPGNVIQVMVKAGDKVAKGAALMIIEAMKMEHTIAAPASGVVKDVFFAKGDQVTDGAKLLEIEAAA